MSQKRIAVTDLRHEDLVKTSMSGVNMKRQQPRHRKFNALYDDFAALPAMQLGDFLERLDTDNEFYCAVLDVFEICGQNAEDAFQAFLVRLYGWLKCKSDCTIDNAPGWLIASAIHARNDYYDKKKTVLKHWEELARHTALVRSQTVMDPAEHASANELSEALDRALATLAPDEHALFVLNYQGESYKNLAQMFGRTPPAIRAWLSRIKKRLKDLLSSYIQDSAWTTR